MRTEPKFQNKTIEVGGRGATYCEKSGYTVYGFRDVVDVGILHTARFWLGHYDTIEEAKEEHPDAELIGGSSFEPLDSWLPKNPPADFDPLDAGESWDEDY